MTKIVLNRDLPEKFEKEWGDSIKPFMVKGWETYYDGIKSSYGNIHPEDNKYKINFPIEWFTVINDEDNYTEDI